MKRQKKTIVQKICILTGAVLLAAAAVVLLLWQQGIRTSAQRAEATVHALRAVLSEPQSAVLEPRRDNTMSVYSLDGTDFVGLLELPQHGSALPVCADWGQVSQYPCRFSGSVYDGSLQIGATSQQGQYDFYRGISVGDALFFTDVEGNRYAYTVSDIRYEKHADQAALGRQESALTLFIKNIYAFEYIIVSCHAAR